MHVRYTTVSEFTKMYCRFMLRPGSAVVEIGFNDYPNVLPTDFYCLARNLGYR